MCSIKVLIKVDVSSLALFVGKIVDKVTNTDQSFLSILFSQCFVLFLETSLFWIGCIRKQASGLQMCVVLSVAQGRGYTGKLSKQFQEAGQSVCHSVSPHHIQQISGSILAVMKHIGMDKCLYVPSGVTLLKARERFMKVHKAKDIKQLTNCICGETSKSIVLIKYVTFARVKYCLGLHKQCQVALT